MVEADATRLDAMEQLGAKEFSSTVVGVGALEASVLITANLVDLGMEQIWAKAISREQGKLSLMSTTQLSTATTSAREEFLDNLRQMATGSYLRDEDREFWEAPYPESAVDDAQAIVDGMLQAAQSVAASSEAELKKIAASLHLQNTEESALSLIHI